MQLGGNTRLRFRLDGVVSVFMRDSGDGAEHGGQSDCVLLCAGSAIGS